MEHSKEYTEAYNAFKISLKEHHLKCTVQREIIFEILYHADEALTIDQLHRLCLDKYPYIRVGMTTVYRTLWFLENAEMITSFVLKTTNTQRFELKKDKHSIYYICNRCGCIGRYADKKIQSYEKKITQRVECIFQNSILKLYGVCRRCSDLPNSH